MSNTNPFEDMMKDLLSEAYKGESFGRAGSLPLPEEMGKLASDTLAEEYTQITKSGMTVPLNFERFLDQEPRKGSYVPTGNKHLQKLNWWVGKQIFRLYQATERRLQKFRHYREVMGYDYEEAEYREFEQKKVWKEES